MSAPEWSEVDEGTASLLDMIQDDWRPFAVEDRNIVAQAIRDDAARHDGAVSANRVRRTIGHRVKPQRVGPVYRALCAQGYLRVDGYEISDDTEGRNSGRPARVYLWTGGAL